jgi:magnesium-transporting ATPase (P-type)
MGTNLENRKIDIEQDTLRNLDTARKWSIFIAILGFMFLVLMLVIGLIAGTFLSAFNSGETGPGLPESYLLISYFVVGILFFFPNLFLFRFSKHTAHAIQNLDKIELYKAFRNLKLFFVYFGILIIIILSIYFTALILSGTSVALIKGI